jgi:Tfp pilus assembly protein PilX
MTLEKNSILSEDAEDLLQEIENIINNLKNLDQSAVESQLQALVDAFDPSLLKVKLRVALNDLATNMNLKNPIHLPKDSDGFKFLMGCIEVGIFELTDFQSA